MPTEHACQPPAVDDHDRRLLQAAGAGEGEAFAELVRRHDSRLRGLAVRMLGDHHRADDVLQEAWLKAYRNLHRFRGDATVATWLYRIAHNACLDELRARSRRPPAASAPDVDRPAASIGPAETAIARHDIGAALARLGPAARLAVVLVDGCGYGYAEAAGLLGVPVGTLASSLFRARASLRACGERAEDLVAA